MPNIASLLKAEIARVARKEVRAQTDVLKTSSKQYRTSISGLRKKVDALEKQLSRLNKVTGRKAPVTDEREADEVRLRFRPSGFASMRKKLGISAAQLGQLLGVTGQSIYAWEQGKTRPRASQLQAIAEVRTLGKREVLKRLGAMT
jgi:DNA-binding transcriptional regulator YiaG